MIILAEMLQATPGVLQLADSVDFVYLVSFLKIIQSYSFEFKVFF